MAKIKGVVRSQKCVAGTVDYVGRVKTTRGFCSRNTDKLSSEGVTIGYPSEEKAL